MDRAHCHFRAFAVACLLAPTLALAAPATTHLRVAKVYSTLDGIAQAIELDIVRVGDQPLVLTDKVLSIRDRRGGERIVPLGVFLNGWYPGRTRLLASTLDGGGFGPARDIALPIAALPIDGGTIEIAGWDMISYGRLPEDGRHAVDRDGNVVPAVFEWWGGYDIADTAVTEFHHAGLDHYFLTNRLDEVLLLTEGLIPGWQPTGKAFYFFTRPLGKGFFPACRYLLQRPGSASHFFSASAQECAALAVGEGNVLELEPAFFVAMPANGSCGKLVINYPNGATGIAETAPIYRLWNGKPETNHRYVGDKTERDAMIARGWIPEGAGTDGIGMCGWWGQWPYP